MYTPNDPQYVLQWNLQAMRVPQAWDVDQVSPIHGGDPRIVVAILDTGIALTSVGATASVPDILPTSIWTNTNEIAGDGIDNDADGYVDDVHGWNFVAHTAMPIDDNGHGTHVAGVIASATDNALATAGIASQVTIMPLKVLNSGGLGTTESLTAAVRYAIQHGANIINLSLGGDEDDPIFHQALQDAAAQGIILISAAGNSGAATVTYPSQYSEVIGVGATNTDGSRAAYSNYGAQLTLMAPVGDTTLDMNHDGQADGVPSQTCTNASCTDFSTIYLSGTSQAAAEVSGVVALLESCGAAPGVIRALLTGSSRDLGPVGRDDQFGYGLVDAYAALSAAGCATGVPAAPTSLKAQIAATAIPGIVALRPSSAMRPLFSWSGASGATYIVTWKRGSSTLAQVKQTATTYTGVVTDEGTYIVSVSTIDALGQVSVPATFSYRYQRSVVAIASGSTVRLLTNELKKLRDITVNVGRMVRLSAGRFGTAFDGRLITTSDAPSATLTMTDTRGKRLFTTQPFGAKFAGMITTAVLQRADGTTQFVAATGSKGASLVWFSANGKVLGRTTVYTKDVSGLNLATGDVDGDGNDELMVSQAQGAEIRVYGPDRKRKLVMTPRTKKHAQGWSIAAGDVNGDGKDEILATPNVGMKKTKILVLSGAGVELKSLAVAGSEIAPLVLGAADTNGDGVDEVISAPQRGAGSLRVMQYSGTLLRQQTLTDTSFRSLATL
jgi:hypothetical protein